MTSNVTSAHVGAAAAGAPSGTDWRPLSTIGTTVTGMSMITVPATVGVKIRRNSERRAARANWAREDITTRVASIAGPPSAIAVTQMAMNAPDVPMART